METVKEKGLMARYRVTKIDGTTNPDAEYFVLRLDDKGSDPVHIAACREAINTYADAIKSHLPLLHDDLKRLYGALWASSVASQKVEKLQEENRILKELNGGKLLAYDAMKNMLDDYALQINELKARLPEPPKI